MHCEITDIPDGSMEVAFFKGGEDAINRDDIDLTFNLKRVSDGVYEVSKAFGDMSNEGNINFGLKAFGLGIKKLTFHTLKGKKVTRWASKVGEDESYSYYEIDLKKAAEKHAIDAAAST